MSTRWKTGAARTTASLRPRKVLGGAVARSEDAREGHQVFDRELASGQVVQPVQKRGGRQVGQEPEPARVDAQDGRGMVFHPPRRVEDGAVATQHDGHVGGQGREVGIGREIDAGQLDPGGAEQRIGHSAWPGHGPRA